MKRKVTLEQAEEALGLGALAARKEGGVIAEKEPEAETPPAPARAKKKPDAKVMDQSSSRVTAKRAMARSFRIDGTRA